MTIFYFDALAGAGKTRALARYADRIAQRGSKVLFVQPTKHLIDKTIADELEPLDPPYPCRAIHGDVTPNDTSVVAEIVGHFREAIPDEGEIVFITHAALMRVPYLHRKADWHLIMDEVPQADIFDEVRLPETHDLILPHLVFEPAGPVYGYLGERDADANHDDVVVSFDEEAA